MFIFKLLAIAYILFFLVAAGSMLLALYEGARDRSPLENGARVSLASHLGTVMVEAGAHLLSWILWPARYLERAAPVHLAGANRTPVLFVHGYLGHTGQFLVLRSRLRNAGLDSFSSYNYPTTIGSLEEMAQELSRQVDKMKTETGAEKIDLVGHSMGGLVALYYVQNLGGAANIRRVISIGSPFAGTRLAPFFHRHAFDLFHPQGDVIKGIQDAAKKIKEPRFICIYSTTDNQIIPGSSGKLEGNAVNHELHNLGHNTLLYSGRVAELVRSELINT